MHRGPIKTRVKVRCQVCGTEFPAKRRDTKYCPPCRVVMWKKQTRESNQKHKVLRTIRQREYYKKWTRKKRNEINRKRRKWIGSNPEIRERLRAFQREWYAAHGHKAETRG